MNMSHVHRCGERSEFKGVSTLAFQLHMMPKSRTCVSLPVSHGTGIILPPNINCTESDLLNG